MNKRSLIFIVLMTVGFFFLNQYLGPKEQPKPKAAIESGAAETLAPLSKEKIAGEKFYVLENDYFQLVFSNVGGALAEINLPFKSKENPNSVVLPIAADRKMEKDSPANDRFPLFGYEKVMPTGNRVSQKEGSLGGYVPLMRRSILAEDGSVLRETPSTYAMNTTSSDNPGLANVIYSLKEFSHNTIVFEGSDGKRTIRKIYSLPQGEGSPYAINFEMQIDGDSSGVMLTSGVPEVELISDRAAPAIKYRTTKSQKPVVEKVSLPKGSETITSINPDWYSNANGFFGIIVDPLSAVGSGFTATEVAGEDLPTRLTLIDAAHDLYPAKRYPGYQLLIPLNGMKNGQFRLVAGPYDNKILRTLDKTYTQEGYNPRYILAQSNHGWFSFISEPFAKFLFILMNAFHSATGSWGFSIILLTIALRIMLYPLNAWSFKSNTRMQEINPEVQKLQERYKKDPKRAQMEVMKLYREKGINPLSGCLPILIQMPFLIGMFDLLKSTFSLRGVPFIPGWINNLTAPDTLFSWGTPIPFFGTSFHLLPLLLGALMFIQSRISTPSPKKGEKLSDQQKQSRMMGNIMTLVFTVMFYNFPAGLNIYWLFSTLLGILQQWMTKKRSQAKSLVKA